MNLNDIPWHTYIIAVGLVGLTVYLVSEANDSAGWAYVLILILGTFLLGSRNTALMNELSKLGVA